jgi:hypothetical protein
MKAKKPPFINQDHLQSSLHPRPGIGRLLLIAQVEIRAGKDFFCYITPSNVAWRELYGVSAKITTPPPFGDG